MEINHFPTQGIYAAIELDGEEKLKVVPTTDLSENQKLIQAAFNKKEKFSFINIGNQIQHCFIKFIGTELDCNQYVDGFGDIVYETSSSSIGSFSCHGLSSEEDEDCDENIKVEEFTTDAKIVILNKSVQELKEKMSVMEAKIDFLIESVLNKNYHAQTSKEKSEKYHLRAEFATILDKKRREKKWQEDIKTLPLSNYDENKRKEIKKLLLQGTSEPGIFIRRLARILFGEEQIEKKLMGIDGKKLKGFKDVDRNVLFSVREELELIEILKKIDENLFTSKDVFDILVRSPLNQCGRDIKKKNIQTCGKSKLRMPQITSYFKPRQAPTSTRKESHPADEIIVDIFMPREE